MLSIQWIRDNLDRVQEVANRRNLKMNIYGILSVDDHRRELLQQIEKLRQKRNQHSHNISKWIQETPNDHTNEKVTEAKNTVKAVNEELAQLEPKLAEAEQFFTSLMLRVPNIVSPGTPVGDSDADNVEVERWGEPAKFDFQPLDHIALGEKHRIIDIPRGVKTSGTRSYYLRGAGALLHRAVQQLAIDVLLNKGFTLYEVPLMTLNDAFVNTGFFPTGEDQTYRIENTSQRLIGTSEVPLVNYYSNEVIDVTQPLKLAATSQCFRSEAGSAGRDVHGLYRVHQFSKVEQIVFCEANLELAESLLQEITHHAKTILEMLELPYRAVAVCTGDMSLKTYKQFDIETWMPSRNAYGETHSSSLLLDYQARRAKIRYRDHDGKLQYCYTLNNTAIASPRILIPLLEVHQKVDGSIYIPKALRPYMNGLEKLTPPDET